MASIRIISAHFPDKSAEDAGLRAYIDALARSSGSDISHAAIRTGPSTIECDLDMALAAPGIIEEAVRAANEGVDAVVVSCFGDPAIAACREAAGILVFGPGQASMQAAALLGRRFSVVTVVESVRPLIERIARDHGVSEKLASIRAIDIPVAQLGIDAPAVDDALSREAIAAVEQDGADVIVLGCTGFLGSAAVVGACLKARGFDVPVLDPLPVTIAMAQALCALGLKHAARAYVCDPAKPTRGYDAFAAQLRARFATR